MYKYIKKEGALIWVIPDGYLPEKSRGELIGHEALCILNTNNENASLKLTVYFEDRDPITDFDLIIKGKRTKHIRLDFIKNSKGEKISKGVPYAMKVESTIPIIVQHSRMDTTQEALTLMTTIAYPINSGN